jgi:hypothetical protein
MATIFLELLGQVNFVLRMGNKVCMFRDSVKGGEDQGGSPPGNW